MKCLQSLYLSDPQDDLAAVRSAKGDRVPGTCEWILTHDRFTAFLVEDGPRLLWLSGRPGIGKTMVSSFLVEELAHLTEQSLQMTLAYYFCDDKDEKRRTATAILRGLLLQLLRQRPVLFKHIQPGFDMSRDTLFTNFHSLWRVFVSVVQDPEADDVYCLVDALDECEKESRQLFLTSLTSFFDLQQDKTTSVKIIVTSRRENDIEEELLSADDPYVQDLHIDKGNVNRDLYKFINVKVNQLAAKRKFRSKKTAEEIERALAQKAGGTFLYVSLVLNELRRTPESQMQRKLQEWPSELNGIYDKILSQIEGGCEDIVKMVLRWIVAARRPLKIREVATACVLSSEDFINNTISSDDLDRHENDFVWCRSFVYVDNLSRTINLVHQSAKEYLLGTYLQTNEALSQYHIVLDKTNLLMFRICWTYLSLIESAQGTEIISRLLRYGFVYYSSEVEGVLKSHCFSKYAIEEWQNHAETALPALATDHEFWKDELNTMATLRDFWLIEAAAKGQESVVQRLLDEGAEPNSQDSDGRTPLSWAAEEGYASIVRLLLSRGDIVADSRDTYDRTSLSFAAERGHEAIVRLLLNREVDVDSRDNMGRTPLSYAAEGGHEAIVRLLLNREVDVDSRDIWGRTPLLRAAVFGHEAIVRLLSSRNDVKVDSCDNEGRTPLSYAAEGGYEAIVKILLSLEVDLNSRDDSGRTPLSYAAKEGHKAIVELLLSRDNVAVDSPDLWGETPLDRAKEREKDAVVRLLEQKMREKDSAARTQRTEEASNDEEVEDHKYLG